MTPELAKQFPKSYEVFFEYGVNKLPFIGKFISEKEAEQKFQFNSIRDKDAPCKISCEFIDGYFYYSISSNESMWYRACSEYIWAADGKLSIEEIEERNIFHEDYNLFDGKVRIKIKRNKSTHQCYSKSCYRTDKCPMTWKIPEYYYMLIHFAPRDYQMYSEHGQEINKKVKEYESLARNIGISDEEVKVKIKKALKNLTHLENPYAIIEKLGFSYVKCPHCGKWHELQYTVENEGKPSHSWRCNGEDYEIVFEVNQNKEITLYHNLDNSKYMREKVLSVKMCKETLGNVEIIAERRNLILKGSEYVIGDIILPGDDEYGKWQKNYWSTKVYKDIIKRYQRLEQIKQDS